jgi:regulator of sigma E protease
MYLAAIDLTVLATKTAQFILSFSIIVVLHELGHFIPARLFGARVEKFYLFLDLFYGKRRLEKQSMV